MKVFTIEFANCDDPAETLLDIYTTRRQAVVDALGIANDVMDECYDEPDGLFELRLLDGNVDDVVFEVSNTEAVIQIANTETGVDVEWWRIRSHEVTEESSFSGQVADDIKIKLAN